MLEDIYAHLKKKELNPYFPGRHKGECEEPFVVIKEGFQMPSIQSNRVGQRIMDFVLFVPIYDYKQVEPYRRKVVQALKELPFLRKTGGETPVIVDDTKKAYTTSIEYVIQKKLEG